MVRVPLFFLLCYLVLYGARRPRGAMPPVVLHQITTPRHASETDDSARTTRRDALWRLVYRSPVANSLPPSTPGVHGLTAQGGDLTLVRIQIGHHGRTLGHVVTWGSSL
jgi:hypothetical protein